MAFRWFNRSPDLVAVAIIGWFSLLAIAFAAATPFGEAPDEVPHFLYVHYVLEEGLPIVGDKASVFARGDTQRSHPPLYYLIGALLVADTQRADFAEYMPLNPFGSVGVVSSANLNNHLHRRDYSGDSGIAFWRLRLYSIALACGTLWFTYLTGKRLFSAPVGLAASLVLASIPTFIHISSSINDDNLITLMSALCLYLCARALTGDSSLRNTLLVGLSVGAGLLSKQHGIALLGYLAITALLGLWQRAWTWRYAFRWLLITVGVAALTTSWWYLRNVLLYGDPLAAEVTLALWGRGDRPLLLAEFEAIWFSFWMILGYFNIRGAEWLYVYVGALTLLGGAGLAWWMLRKRADRLPAAFLVGCFLSLNVVVFVMLLRVAGGQGRIYFPVAGAFALLLVVGGRALIGKFAPLVAVPLAAMALITPFTYLPRAYPTLEVVETVPPTATRLAIRAETLTLHAYALETSVLARGEPLRLTLYFSGKHAENAHFFAVVVNPRTGEGIGGVDTFLGMAASADLNPDLLYRATVSIPMLADLLPEPPMQVQVQLGWRVGIGGRALPLTTLEGAPLESLVVNGAVLLDSAWQPPPAETKAEATFGGALRLTGYTLSAATVRGGAELSLTLHWEGISRLAADYQMAFGVLDERDQVVVQADGAPHGYPTSAWQIGVPFAETRRLTLPPDLPNGVYRLYIGWYDQNGERLPLSAGETLYFVPLRAE
jgi:4-amino-4-deoxy-L-arabinose transferase-like glycosyltransferase